MQYGGSRCIVPRENVLREAAGAAPLAVPGNRQGATKFCLRLPTDRISMGWRGEHRDRHRAGSGRWEQPGLHSRDRALFEEQALQDAFLPRPLLGLPWEGRCSERSRPLPISVA
jgi:hypothetical protein